MTICACVCAYSVRIEGLYYTLNDADLTATVIASPKKDYVGEVIIDVSCDFLKQNPVHLAAQLLRYGKVILENPIIVDLLSAAKIDHHKRPKLQQLS